MSVSVKICGLKNSLAIDAAIAGGADYLGFVFCPDSKSRKISAEQAAGLIGPIPQTIATVGLFVNPSDDEIKAVVSVAPINFLQLHGEETPQRVAAIKSFTGLPVIKAIGVAESQDVSVAHNYADIADILLLDAKAVNVSRGGNGRTFNWSLLSGVRFTKPWMLAGGLNAENIDEAVSVSGARILDISSGVEDAPGHKNPQKIKDFLVKARWIATSS